MKTHSIGRSSKDRGQNRHPLQATEAPKIGKILYQRKDAPLEAREGGIIACCCGGCCSGSGQRQRLKKTPSGKIKSKVE